MELHVSRVHKGRSTKCHLCGKGVRIRAKLKNLEITEVRVVRRVGTKVLVMERLTSGAGRKEDFKCDLCGVDSCEPANLKQHKGGWCGFNLSKGDPCGLVFKVGKHLKSGIYECDSFGTAKEVSLAMMRKAEPRTHDLFIVKPANEDSGGDAGQEVNLAVIGEVA
jgi:hypothetical protein